MKKLCTLFFLFVSTTQGSSAQERVISEEVRALAILCSSGSSVQFRGQIEGGLNNLFGKIISGDGELNISENETDFLNAFEDEPLRIEARRIYNECALGALQILVSRKKSPNSASATVSLLVPDELAEIAIGNRFALMEEGSVMLEGGGIFATQGANDSNPKDVSVNVSNNGTYYSDMVRVGKFMKVPGRENCNITHIGSRESESKNRFVYSFIYQCTAE